MATKKSTTTAQQEFFDTLRNYERRHHLRQMLTTTILAVANNKAGQPLTKKFVTDLKKELPDWNIYQNTFGSFKINITHKTDLSLGGSNGFDFYLAGTLMNTKPVIEPNKMEEQLFQQTSKFIGRLTEVTDKYPEWSSNLLSHIESIRDILKEASEYDVDYQLKQAVGLDNERWYVR